MQTFLLRVISVIICTVRSGLMRQMMSYLTMEPTFFRISGTLLWFAVAVKLKAHLVEKTVQTVSRTGILFLVSCLLNSMLLSKSYRSNYLLMLPALGYKSKSSALQRWLAIFLSQTLTHLSMEQKEHKTKIHSVTRKYFFMEKRTTPLWSANFNDMYVYREIANDSN